MSTQPAPCEALAGLRLARWHSSRSSRIRPAKRRDRGGGGPGRLSIGLARRHDLDVTGFDLDPAMIERARANAQTRADDDERRPSFVVGDVASLAFPDGSFDLVVSTLSMHHWADPMAGLAEIGRVLRPGGRALVWDFRAGPVPLHGHLPDPAEHVHGSPLRVVRPTPWSWPWRFNLLRRIELVRAVDVPRHRSTRSATRLWIYHKRPGGSSVPHPFRERHGCEPRWDYPAPSMGLTALMITAVATCP
jgi:SAM-dependent methyltransferase